MEKPLDDRCTTRTATSRTKTAAGIAVYLVEELGDARLRCAQLKKYVSDATGLIEHSQHRDHFYEVAAHLIEGIPGTLFRLEKALDAAAMSAARMDYEEIKQNLLPAKAEELETVLQDARTRLLQRRSGQVSNAKQAVEEISRIADVADATGSIPVGDLMVLLANLERGSRTSAVEERASDRLRKLAGSWSERKNPSRIELAQSIRTFLAETVQPTAAQTAAALMQGGSREEVEKGFKSQNPNLTEEQLKRIGDEWEKNRSVVKDKAKEASVSVGAVKAKRAGLEVLEALPSLNHGGQMLGQNVPMAMVMLASGVQKLGTALHTCGLTDESKALLHASTQLQDVAKTLSTL